MLRSTVVHELVHRCQYKKFKLFYHILNIPLIRELYLEREARKWELIADNYFDKVHDFL